MRSKKITNITKIIIALCNICTFYLVWSTDYNDKAFFTSKTYGLVTSLFIYCVLYLWLCRIYRAFSIASNPVGETVFSQMIAFGISDMGLYLMCVLLRKRLVDFRFMILAMVLQFALTTLIVMCAKRVLMKKITPIDTLLVCGDEIGTDAVDAFKEKLLKRYYHLFEVSETVQLSRMLIDHILDHDEVILYGLDVESRNRLAMQCINQKKVFYFVPDVEDIVLRSCEVKYYMDVPILRYNYEYEKNDIRFMKRFFDIFISFIGLVIAALPMLVVGLLIHLEDRGPVFFTQKRVTENGKVFKILKFRSMVVDADSYGVNPTVDKDPRITRIGAFIRKTRLDELPQLVNILKGDMSFVGPRPERIEHVIQYEKEYPAFAYRKSVKAGLTGYAQVYGKYNTSAEDKLKLDLFYIENQSLLLDFKIMLLTVKTVFQGESTEGFSAEKSREMREQTTNEQRM